VARALAAGRLLDAVAVVDGVLRAAGWGALGGADLRELRSARALLAGRRAARAGAPR
jgi:hypothetical protein